MWGGGGIHFKSFKELALGIIKPPHTTASSNAYYHNEASIIYQDQEFQLFGVRCIAAEMHSQSYLDFFFFKLTWLTVLVANIRVGINATCKTVFFAVNGAWYSKK